MRPEDLCPRLVALHPADRLRRLSGNDLGLHLAVANDREDRPRRIRKVDRPLEFRRRVHCVQDCPELFWRRKTARHRNPVFPVQRRQRFRAVGERDVKQVRGGRKPQNLGLLSAEFEHVGLRARLFQAQRLEAVAVARKIKGRVERYRSVRHRRLVAGLEPKRRNHLLQIACALSAFPGLSFPFSILQQVLFRDRDHPFALIRVGCHRDNKVFLRRNHQQLAAFTVGDLQPGRPRREAIVLRGEIRVEQLLAVPYAAAKMQLAHQREMAHRRPPPEPVARRTTALPAESEERGEIAIHPEEIAVQHAIAVARKPPERLGLPVWMRRDLHSKRFDHLRVRQRFDFGANEVASDQIGEEKTAQPVK